MTEPLSLLTAVLLGLFGASHCLVMCGGIAASMGTRMQHHRWLGALVFNGGRITSYAMAGALVGALGLWLQSQHQGFMVALRLFAGVLLILMGLYIARWATWLTRLEQLGQHLWRHLQPLTKPLLGSHELMDRWLLGMLWGWLPCGLIYSTLSWVAANGNPVDGAAAMLAFGLGTLPAMFTSTLAASALINLISKQWVRSLSGLLLIAYGAWTILGVLPLDNAH
ncbi:cytochrome biogenesis protein [Bacterioplanes sanyensis]|uniref:Cytochrome biogenesis protein n=1 Tax=Bacterioplanes sanyensis TaxID=1249553 RepID=A0A222FP35_9GAMM|nr:sulfite exporter TauE/SafE family protein [Bacterioplanes sanyensis]ASP40296.1 cytochrome biogenesis protein [Bacterioplanes sanyensis]